MVIYIKKTDSGRVIVDIKFGVIIYDKEVR